MVTVAVPPAMSATYVLAMTWQIADFQQLASQIFRRGGRFLKVFCADLLRSKRDIPPTPNRFASSARRTRKNDGRHANSVNSGACRDVEPLLNENLIEANPKVLIDCGLSWEPGKGELGEIAGSLLVI
jgi:hypothetical protein